MGGKAPKTPPAPDPFATAAAQTGSNVTSAIANSWLGNANVKSPLGTVTNQQRTKGGKPLYQTVSDPATGQSFQVPLFEQIIKLDPAQKTLLNQQNKIGSQLNKLAYSQSKRLTEHLQNRPDLLSQLPGVRDAPTDVNFDGLPELANDMDAYRGQVESALFERLNPQLQRDYDALESKLVNQGLVRGSKAFNEAMDEHLRAANDARTQVFLASGNEARAMQNELRSNRGQLFNERLSANNDARANREYDMALRNQRLQELLTERNQPINEITALMGGGQVSMPQFAPYNAGQVDTVPVGSYVYNSANINQQNANAAAQNRAQMFNSLGQLGALGLFAFSDERLKTDVRYAFTDEAGLDWYEFRYLDSDEPEYGVIAQEVAKVRPEAVVETVGGLLQVNYGAL